MQAKLPFIWLLLYAKQKWDFVQTLTWTLLTHIRMCFAVFMHKTYRKKAFSYRVDLVSQSWIHTTHQLTDRFIWMQPVHKSYSFAWRIIHQAHMCSFIVQWSKTQTEQYSVWATFTRSFDLFPLHRSLSPSSVLSLCNVSQITMFSYYPVLPLTYSKHMGLSSHSL